VRTLYPADDGTGVVATPEIMQVCERLYGLADEIKSAEHEFDELRERVEVFMQDSAELLDPSGRTLVTWRKAKDSHPTDWKFAYYSMLSHLIEQAVMGPEPERMHAIADSFALVAWLATETKPGSRRLLLKRGAR